MILKAIHTGVGFGSGTETRYSLEPSQEVIRVDICTETICQKTMTFGIAQPCVRYVQSRITARQVDMIQDPPRKYSKISGPTQFNGWGNHFVLANNGTCSVLCQLRCNLPDSVPQGKWGTVWAPSPGSDQTHVMGQPTYCSVCFMSANNEPLI